MKINQRLNLPKCLDCSNRINNEITVKKSINDSIHNNNNQLKIKNKTHILLKNLLEKTEGLSPYQNIKIFLKDKSSNSQKNIKYEIKDNSFNINSVSSKKNKSTQKNFIDSDIITKITKNISLIAKKNKISDMKAKKIIKNKNNISLNNKSRNISLNNHEKIFSSFDYCLNYKNKSEILKKNSSQIINIYSYVDNKSNKKKLIKQNIIKLFSSYKMNKNYKKREISRNSSRGLSSKNNQRIINEFKDKFNNFNSKENIIKSHDNRRKENFIEEMNNLNQKINTKQEYNNQFSFRNTYPFKYNKNWKTAVLESIIKNIRNIGKEPDKLNHHRNNIKLYTILNLNKKQ